MRPNSCGVSCTRSPPDRDGPLLEVDDEIADLEHRLGRRPDPAECRPQPREQLVDAERLRDVVVRAGVERGDLLALLADGREDEDRDARPRPQLAADVDPAPVGEDEVEDDRLGRANGGGRQRRLGGRGRVDLVAGAAEGRLERAQDLRLVVDDEDARPARHAATGSGGSATGRASANEAPCPGCDSAQTRPPFASANPRAMARPRPVPGASVPAAVGLEGVEDALEIGLGDARALVDDAQDDVLSRVRGADEHGRLLG